jgi:glycosyltransferase involved in cell wall biosynthesis
MKLSVVIPAYNRAALLPITLRSLLAQERVADEILVVDDGSTDDTAEVAEAFGHPVRVIRQANQGPGAARNRGLSEAQGEFVHFFDSDDLALPNLHRLQLEALESSSADIAYSPWVKVRMDPSLGIQPTNHVLQARGLPRGFLVQALLTNWSVVPICCLVRLSLAVQSRGFPTTLQVAEDQLFFLRLLLHDAAVVHTPSTLVLYRDEAQAKLSGGGAESQIRQLIEWARFLVKANSECRHFHVEPTKWFGFRRRVYLAAQALELLENPPVSLINDLHTIISDSPMPHACYRLSRLAQQKGEGLTSRLYGRRAHRSFCSAPISARQLAMAAQAREAMLLT